MTTVYSTVTDGAGAWRIPLPAGLAAGSHIIRRRMVQGGVTGAWRRQSVTLTSDDVARIDAAWALAAAEGYAAGVLRQGRVAALLAGGASAALMTYLVTAGLAGSVAGADFRLGRYWLPAPGDASVPTDATEAAFFAQFTAASTTARTYFDASGVMRADLAANQPRFSNVSGSRRLVLEGALTNKVTCRKHNPTDTTNVTPGGDAAAVLSVVDDATALAAAGLGAVCTNGKVYKLDNTAGVAAAHAIMEGTTGNTNPHVREVFARGSGDFQVQYSGGSGLSVIGVTFTLTTAYRRCTAASVSPTAGSQRLVVYAPAGTVVYFIFPGLYEQSFAPHAPIVGDTAAAVTRAIETCRLPAAMESVVATGAYSGLVRAAMAPWGSGAVQFSAGAGNELNRMQLFLSAGGRANLLGAAAGMTTVNAVSAGSAIIAGEAFGIAAAIAVTDYAVDDSKGALATSSAAGALPAVTSVYLGRRQDGGAYGNGVYDLVAVWPTRLANASIQALAVPYA